MKWFITQTVNDLKVKHEVVIGDEEDLRNKLSNTFKLRKRLIDDIITANAQRSEINKGISGVTQKITVTKAYEGL